MSIKANVIKGWVTTLAGTATIVITLVLVWQKVFDFVWEGIGGLAIGTILVLSPKDISKKLSEGIKAWGGKDEDDDYRGGYHPHHYEVPTPPEVNEPSIKDEPEQN